MAKRSRMSILKRQRELRKSEKAAHKRAKRHGLKPGESTEPRATMSLSDFGLMRPADDDEEPETAEEEEEA